MYPLVFVAALAALYFLVMTVRRPHAAGGLTFVLWAAYAVYEYFIANGTLCDANCNIRVDMVLFLPVLVFATYLGLKREPHPRAVAGLLMVCLVLLALIALLFGNTMLAAAAGAGALLVAAWVGKSMVSKQRP